MNVGVPDLSEKVIRRKTYLEHSNFEILKKQTTPFSTASNVVQWSKAKQDYPHTSDSTKTAKSQQYRRL